MKYIPAQSLGRRLSPNPRSDPVRRAYGLRVDIADPSMTIDAMLASTPAMAQSAEKAAIVSATGRKANSDRIKITSEANTVEADRRERGRCQRIVG